MIRKIGCALMIFIVLSGCKSTTHFQPGDVDQIKIDLVDRSEQPSGTAYTFKLSNHSNYEVVQNDLYLSYPMISNQGLQRQSNKAKVEATGNKLHIKPGDELMLFFFYPKQDFEGNPNLDPGHPELEFKGYIGTLAEENHFSKSGGFESFR